MLRESICRRTSRHLRGLRLHIVPPIGRDAENAADRSYPLLEFEITESALIHDEEHALRVLEELRRRGCTISLGDFGTGYSSVFYLKRFPVQTLKIDRSFVSGIGTSTDDEAITSAIPSMAQNLGFRVVTEGIETGEQAEFLIDRKCDELQGYLFNRPLPADEFRDFLDAYTARS